jgi:SAM-dependent methyltransferase
MDPVIPSDSITFAPSSYMDPQGRVFFWNDGIYRALTSQGAKLYPDFLESQTCKQMMASGALVSTEVTDYSLEGFRLVLRHKRLEPLSYCFEWAPEMLKEAALLTLELCHVLSGEGLTLQDAYPWNILFEGTKPVYLDFSSIIRTNRSYIWIPYQQFCDHFYHPLLLNKTGRGRMSRSLLHNHLEGVLSEDIRDSLTLSQKLTLPGYFSRIALPSLISSRLASGGAENRMRSMLATLSKEISDSQRRRFFDGLTKDIENINLRNDPSAWEGYYSETNDEELRCKLGMVDSILSRLKPATTLDIGCNTGAFSVLAAKAGSRVVAIDSDEACVSRLYVKAREDALDILPLVMQILSPTAAFGCCESEFPPASERLSCDMVLLLAVIHHLALTHAQSFERIIKTVKRFQKNYAIYEYVDRADKMADRLRRRIAFDDEWYTYDNFMKSLGMAYSEVELVGSVSPTRKVILCRN